MSPEAWAVLRDLKHMRSASPSLAAEELSRLGMLDRNLHVTDKGRLYRRRKLREEAMA